nr:uncharacterized protein LOC121130481 [Lepeophtheirus salmonis]
MNLLQLYLYTLIFLDWKDFYVAGEARSFTEDPFLTDEKFREKVPTKEILGVIDGKAMIPCDLTPPFPSDSPHLILFYKDIYGTPIYSFDMRGGENGGHHWVDNRTLGPRGHFSFHETGSYSETGAPLIASFLEIEPLVIEDRGTYRCRVDFREAPTKNTRIKLNLIVPPGAPLLYTGTETPLLDGLTNPVREDSTLVLVCETIGGDPLPRLTWWKNNQILDNGVEEIDSKTLKVRNILRLPNLKRSHHASTLTCRASNTNLTSPVSSSLKINMVFPPVRAKIVREWSFFRAEQAYNVSCQVLGSRPAASTSIFVGPSQLREVNYQISPDGNVSTTTVIFIPSESDQNRFLTCRAENMELPSSAVEDQWKIDVHYPPKVELHLVDRQINEIVRLRDDVYLRCDVDANPMPHTIRWIFERSPLQIPKNDKTIFITDDTLILKTVDESKSGVYSCEAENQIGKSASKPLILNVKSSPVCSTDPSITSVALHENVELSCTVKANPIKNIRFHWSLNTSSDAVDFPSSRYKSTGLTSHLVYSPKTALDYGTVTCSASNELGPSEAPCIYHIRPAGKPEGLKNCTNVNQTQESLTVLCSPGFDGGMDQKFILEIYDSRTRLIISNVTNSKPVFYIHGLSSGTEYYVEIYAVNSKGKSIKTHFETFTLQPAEKQLAATTTDLASNNPMRLFPIIGILVTVILFLIIFTVIIVIVVKKHRNASSNYMNGSPVSAGSMSSIATTANSTLRRRDDYSDREIPYGGGGGGKENILPNSPDVIPSKGDFLYDRVDCMRYNPKATQYLDDINSTFFHPSAGGKVPPNDCRYAELSFNHDPKEVEDQRRHLLGGKDGGVVYAKIDPNMQRQQQQQRRKHPLIHSHNCPLKNNYSSATLPHRSLPSALSTSSSSQSNRSSTLKRVAFKDDLEKNVLPLDDSSIPLSEYQQQSPTHHPSGGAPERMTICENERSERLVEVITSEIIHKIHDMVKFKRRVKVDKISCALGISSWNPISIYFATMTA